MMAMVLFLDGRAHRCLHGDLFIEDRRKHIVCRFLGQQQRIQEALHNTNEGKETKSLLCIEPVVIL